MFNVCLDFCVVYGVGVCVNVCGVVSVFPLRLCVVCCVMGVLLFFSYLCSCIWRCSFMGSLLGTQLLYRVRCFVLYVICLCLMLMVTVWCKRTRVWVFLWLCMLRGSFPLVSPILLM